MFKKFLALTAILIISILGYGYWHTSTHGWLNLSLQGISSKERTPRSIKDAKISFLSSEGNLLAKGKSDSLHGIVYLSHPEAGFCVEEESRAPYSKNKLQSWYDCYEKQSNWVVKWIRDVQYIDLEFDTCRFKKIPVTVIESKDDWWLWWVPLPHTGGKPSSYFRIDIQVNIENCPH